MEYKHELVIPNEDFPFKLFLFEGKNGNYQVAKHWHSSIEIFLVLKGNLEFFIDATKYPLSNNVMLLVNSNQIHSILAKYPNETIVLQIPFQVFEKYCNPEGYIYFKQFDFSQDEEIKNFIRIMFAAYQTKAYGYELEVMSIFYQLIYTMVIKYSETQMDEEEIRHYQNLKRLSKITKYIKLNYNQDISLEGVAKEFGFSANYLSRMFQKYANMNYKSYVLDIRTEYALKELLLTDHNINTIALTNGFPSNKSFSRAFQHRYGILPSEYRKKNLQQ